MILSWKKLSQEESFEFSRMREKIRKNKLLPKKKFFFIAINNFFFLQQTSVAAFVSSFNW